MLFGSYAPSLLVFRGPLIRSIVARGHNIYALAPDIDEATAAELVDLGAEPLEVRLDRSGLDPISDLRTRNELTHLFRQIRPDVVIAYTVKPIALGAPAARAAGVARFVPMMTGLGYAFTGGREAKRLLSRFVLTVMLRHAFRRSDLVIFQNPDDRADAGKLGLLPASCPTALIAGSGIELDRFRATPVPSGPPVFLMVARLIGDKGVREYAKAARQLKSRHPETRALLVGYFEPSPNGINEAELRAMEADGVEFLGRLSDVRPALADCTVYVLPSYREGTPRSVLEAMATGRAIITTDAPGCRQTVEEGINGFLVPPRDPNALLGAMLRFVERPSLAIAMGAASRRRAEELYDVNKVNSHIIAHAGL